MVRDVLCTCCCAGLILVGAAPLVAGPEDNRDKIDSVLNVQTALSRGKEALQLGHYQSAVYILEREVGQIEGNKAYLGTLREAYLGLIRELQQKNQPAEAALYTRRLKNIDAAALLDLQTPAAPERPASLPVSTQAPAPTSANPQPAPPPAQPQPAVKQPGPEGMIARGKAEESSSQGDRIDPLSDANRAQPSQARLLLARADQEYAARRYDVAGQLYEQAAKMDSGVAAQAKEPWAYCKIYGVAQSMNRAATSGQPLPAQQLEQELRLAMSMTPKVEGMAKDVLRQLQERKGQPGSPVDALDDGARIQVRHTPAQGQGWAVAETTNFRVFHNQPQDLAERVARSAEGYRLALHRKWLGEVAQTWNPRCDIYLYVDRYKYTKDTGQPSDCPGHSTLRRDGERVLSRRIDLHCDNPNMITGFLPHEMTHVVLYGRFGNQDLPRWADEGMAVLGEPRERAALHLRTLPEHQRERQLFAVADLMQYREYPEGRYIGSFYAQSVSLVDYLVSLKGPPVFVQFLRDGMRGGYEAALRQHYHFQSFLDLQNHWQAEALVSGNSRSASADHGR